MTLNVFIAVWFSHLANLAGRLYSINFVIFFFNMLVTLFNLININELRSAYPGGRAVQCVSLRPLVCWNYGIEYRRDF